VFDSTVHLRPAPSGTYTVESGRADYDAAHIPGAAFADLVHDLSDPSSDLRFTLPSVPALEAALSRLGLSERHSCVVYSTGSVMWATRLWWMLRALGCERVFVLDGGLAKWRAEGRPIATGNETYPPAQFVATPVARRWADRDEVLAAIGDGAVCTINALTASVHAGTSETSYGRKGHIAGSVNVPFPALLEKDGTFAAPEQIRAAFEAAGVLGAPRKICYCGGGIAATLDALALALIGHTDVAVYDGSLSEWSRDPALPMQTGA
jgi:thiosulfate/3-mercaptopyruvate sulfurtransferase